MSKYTASILVAATLLIAGQVAAGGQMDAVGYTLGVSTNINLLRDPDNPISQAVATWRTSAEIALARKTPVVRLTNTSDRAVITAFSLDINDLDHVFDAIVIAEKPIGSTPIIDSPLDSTQGGSTSSLATFSFEDRPLRPNESFAIWLDIDAAELSATTPVDFRDVLWNRSASSRSDNALVSVEFDSTEFGPTPFFEYQMADQVYSSLSSDGTSGQSLVFPLMHSDDSIGAFFLRQQTRTEFSPIPEPAGIALMCLGAAFLIPCFRPVWRNRVDAKISGSQLAR